MQTINYLMNNYGEELLLINFSLLLILFIIIIIQGLKTSKLNKLYKKMFKGVNIQNIEELLLYQKDELKKVSNSNDYISSNLDNIKEILSKNYSKSSIYKYNAFDGIAGKLSFVYVLLNKENNGVILNGIYSNEGHYLYIKEVTNGKTEKDLSREETICLNEAIGK